MTVCIVCGRNSHHPQERNTEDGVMTADRNKNQKRVRK